MIVRCFHKYDISYTKTSGSLYMVTVTGDYCPNPSIPNLSDSGTITFQVNIDAKSCIVKSDPENIMGTFMVFIVNGYH